MVHEPDIHDNEDGNRDFTFLLFLVDPVIVDVVMDEVVNETNLVDIECDARDGYPEDFKYHWEFDPKYADLEPDFSCFERTCEIPVAERKHAGTYNCTASNWDGAYRKWNTSHLDVKCKLVNELLYDYVIYNISGA